MTTTLPFGASDADVSAMAELVAESRTVRARKNAAEAAEVRLLARAGRVALRQARGAQAQEMALRSIAAELAAAANDSDRAVRAQIDRALTLVEHYPAALTAFEDGRILRRHLELVREIGSPLDADARALFDAAAVVQCERDSPPRVRPILQLLAERLHPRTLTERHRDAREHRMVKVVPLGDGMAELIATLPVTLAHAIHDRLTRQAGHIRDIRERARRDVITGRDPGDPCEPGREPSPAEVVASDERSTDQIRVDLLTDMLLTSRPTDPGVIREGPGELGAIRAIVQVTVPVLTLLGRSEEPGELTGISPIDGPTSRELAAGCAGVDRILTHPITGAVLTTDRYQPSADLKRFLRGRDHRCRFPGCRMPAVRCDTDHTRDHALGGPTRDDNLEHLCRGHHTLKHSTPWKVRQLPHGVLEWTSPVGHVYTDHPPGPAIPGATADSVGFTPDGDPPPFRPAAELRSPTRRPRTS